MPQYPPYCYTLGKSRAGQWLASDALATLPAPTTGLPSMGICVNVGPSKIAQRRKHRVDGTRRIGADLIVITSAGRNQAASIQPDQVIGPCQTVVVIEASMPKSAATWLPVVPARLLAMIVFLSVVVPVAANCIPAPTPLVLVSALLSAIVVILERKKYA